MVTNGDSGTSDDRNVVPEIHHDCESSEHEDGRDEPDEDPHADPRTPPLAGPQKGEKHRGGTDIGVHFVIWIEAVHPIRIAGSCAVSLSHK